MSQIQLLVDDSLKLLKGAQALHQLAVDPERRRRCHAQIARLDDARVDLVAVTIGAQAGAEIALIQAKRSGEIAQVVVGEGAGVLTLLIQKQGVMILPEAVLF